MRRPNLRIKQIQFPHLFYNFTFRRGTGKVKKLQMKKLLFFLCACFICLTSVRGQSLTEVLYLKNGSIIRGTIIEQVPNESIKIQTSDGSIFAYPMVDVLKITKEQAINNYSNNNVSFQRTMFRNNYAAQRGYKGFADFGGGFGVNYWAGGFVGLATSHGYQFNPYIFLGAGVGFNYDFGNKSIFIPVFADFRYNVLNSNITPIFGTKIGYSVYDGQGVFFNPSIGCRFGLSKSFALNLTFNYGLQTEKWWDYYGYSETILLHTIGFKLGIEF